MIHLRDSHQPINVKQLIVKENARNIILNSTLDDEIQKAWNETSVKNPSAQDAQIAYLNSYKRNENSIEAEIFWGNYRYNQFFNRSVPAPEQNFGYEPFATWTLPICDGHAVFGFKTNVGAKKVSAFGGYTRKKTDFLTDFRQTYLSEFATLQERVLEENITGLNQSPLIGFRGYDCVLQVSIDGKRQEMQELFQENTQFSKELIFVPNDPVSLLAFLERTDIIPTNSCRGGVISHIASTWGEGEAKKTLDSYSLKDLILFEDRF